MGIFDVFKTPPTPPPPSESVNQPQTNVSAKKVLIVEDEQMLGDALELQLKHDGYTVIRAENGQIGLDKAQSEKPNLILLDLLMPVMDGKTMLRKLRELQEFKDLPVIVLTNAGDIDNMRETKLYNNALAFLIKSNVSPQEISGLVKDTI